MTSFIRNSNYPTMNIMDEAELFTVKVFQAHDRRESHDGATMVDDQNTRNNDLEKQTKPIAEFQNMVSARVIKGRMLELEHSNLAGPVIKFKTVINFEKSLDPNTLIGVSFKSQDGYIKQHDDDDDD